MKFSGLPKICIRKNYIFLIISIIINAVRVQTNQRRVLVVPDQFSRAISDRYFDIFHKTPNDAYSPVFNSSRTNEISKIKGVLGSKENVTREEYFLGYSNNIFGSYTKYIKQMSPRYYASKEIAGQSRRKRSVLHLYNMVLCATGCNPLSYKGYGCYCGFLGSGYVVDGIDRCCKIHDWCYDTAGCPMFLEYFIPYLWKCYNHHYPLCAIDHGEFGGPGSCAQKLCECDRQLAQCLRMYPCPSNKALCTSSPWRLLQNLLMN